MKLLSEDNIVQSQHKDYTDDAQYTHGFVSVSIMEMNISDRNSFFDIFAELLTSIPLMQDEGQVVMSETVWKVLHNYIVNNAQQIEVNHIILIINNYYMLCN